MSDRDMTSSAFPRFIVQDGKPTTEPSLSPNFFERNLSHLIGRRTVSGVWPADPEDAEAIKAFQDGQHALYEEKDAVAAIRFYEAALARDAGYLKAWVALVIAYITDNTPDSLTRAEETLTALCAIEPGEWVSEEASSILYQNRAYLNVHRYRQGGDRTLLVRAAEDYRIADERSGERPRIEYLCPAAYVAMERGERETARALWERARTIAQATGATHLLAEYAAKYSPLRVFL